jgi:hypothetical protein
MQCQIDLVEKGSVKPTPKASTSHLANQLWITSPGQDLKLVNYMINSLECILIQIVTSCQISA